eukprot:PhF_6_TR41333/c0_g1_i2/m.62679/K01460/gsp; glutathionylspermidine amidase/synthetase
MSTTKKAISTVMLPGFVTPYGTLLGTYRGVPGYSNGSDEYFSGERHVENVHGKDVFMGIKWQCVEYARRWLVYNKASTIPSIPCAYDIWDVTAVLHIPSNEYHPLVRVPNGSKVPPQEGHVIIWGETEESPYGHVAIISGVDLDGKQIFVAEQNKDNDTWETEVYSRRLRLEGDSDHGYSIVDPDEAEFTYGWLYIADTVTTKPHMTLSCMINRVHLAHDTPCERWLDMEDPADRTFYEDFKETTFKQRDPNAKVGYYLVSGCVQELLGNQTQELHNMCKAATEFVLKSDELMDVFGLPQPLWNKIRKSWTRGDRDLTGRFDIGFDGDKFKIFEYNSDSSGCLYECAVWSEKWAQGNHGVMGTSVVNTMHAQIVAAWRRLDLQPGEVVHFCIDTEKEELYNALYMQRACREAGVEAKICILFDSFKWNAATGGIEDSEGRTVKYVWKTWMWETCIQRWKDDPSPPNKAKTPRLQDVLLHDDIIVFEPLWKVVTSNKAILPILYQLYPNHPALLKSSFTLTEDLATTKYVQKPIVGRCGHNVSLVDGTNNAASTIEKAEGGFGNRKMIYQEMFEI